MCATERESVRPLFDIYHSYAELLSQNNYKANEALEPMSHPIVGFIEAHCMISN